MWWNLWHRWELRPGYRYSGCVAIPTKYGSQGCEKGVCCNLCRGRGHHWEAIPPKSAPYVLDLVVYSTFDPSALMNTPSFQMEKKAGRNRPLAIMFPLTLTILMEPMVFFTVLSRKWSVIFGLLESTRQNIKPCSHSTFYGSVPKGTCNIGFTGKYWPKHNNLLPHFVVQ